MNMNKNVELKGKSVTHYNCVLCGNELSEKDYFRCDDLCSDCRRDNYDLLSRDYTDTYGLNKIDEILISKVRKGK